MGLVDLPTWMADFYGKCRCIYHTWMLWARLNVGDLLMKLGGCSGCVSAFWPLEMFHFTRLTGSFWKMRRHNVIVNTDAVHTCMLICVYIHVYMYTCVNMFISLGVSFIATSKTHRDEFFQKGQTFHISGNVIGESVPAKFRNLLQDGPLPVINGVINGP